MNLAIVIGVSKYSNPADNLPSCKNDALAVHEILLKTEKFGDILYINNDETSGKTKELVVNFISENKGKTVEELFFYYSGHGEFLKDEFYYVLSDFDIKKRNQTSLQNSEMDNLFRTLSSNLIVKVIDACQSGTSYIKESNVLDTYFKKSTDRFKNCYFIHSSLNTQASYIDSHISRFTLSFINALKAHSESDIRYKDIIDIVSDEFDGDPDQTPFFVIQADLTEKFCSFNKRLKEYLSGFQLAIPNPLSNEVSKPLSILDIVRHDAKNYATREEALRSLEVVRKQIGSFVLNNQLKDLYQVKVDFLDKHSSIPYKSPIVKWLKENPNEYFVTPIFVSGYDDEIGEYQELTGFDLKTELPFKEIVIDVIGVYPNLSSYNSQIVFFLSKKSIRYFYFISNYIDENWEARHLNTKNVKWITLEEKISDILSASEKIKEVCTNIQMIISKDLEDKFNTSGSGERNFSLAK